MPSSKRILSVFSLVMINVIAVDSIRTLPITAKLGLPLVMYFLVAAVVFFIPVALISAELATAYPQTGGIYVWVREAFGKRIGFITIWLQWIYNVVWYPTIMAFIASTIAYLINPQLTNHTPYLLCTIIPLFWLFTLLNCFGMRASNIVSTIGAILGTLVPLFGIIFLGCFWLFNHHAIAVTFPPTTWLPDLGNAGSYPLFAAVLFGLLGMEMSAVHAEEVKNPQYDYPRALLYSTIIIFTTLTLGSMAIVLVVPQANLSMVSGLMDAYAFFFNALHMSWMIPVIALCIIVGSLSGVSTWIIGPTKGLMIAAQDGCLPACFSRVNRYNSPVFILIIQALIFTLMSSVFVMVDSINAAYWLLSDMCAQMALLVYVFMFAAAIKLRYSQPQKYRAYKIPGGHLGMWLVAGLGLIACIFTIGVGFIPPSQVRINDVMFFECFLIAGLIIFLIIPWLLCYKIKAK